MKLLAIDIGASGGKAVVGEIKDSRLAITPVRRFHNSAIDVLGHKYWDILRLVEEVGECLREAPDADSVDKIVEALKTSRVSERSGRAQDKESAYMMQKLRSLGYM